MSIAWTRLLDLHFAEQRRPSRLAGDTPEQKLLLNHEVTVEGCWRWLGAHRGKGYGRISVGGQMVATHRLAHELWIGPIPDGHEVDHVAARGCVHRDCINPAHLEAVTPLENIARRRRINGDKTHCKHGHPFIPENIYTEANGHRHCRQCKRERDRRRRSAA